MSIAPLDAIRRMAEALCESATHIADHVVQFSALSEGETVKYAKAHSISTLPKVAGMDIGYGMKAWAAILSVDMVGSSPRAVRIGARDTFITMHTYLPVMAELAAKKGFVVGLRGDGLFAAYGLTELRGDVRPDLREVGNKAVGDAARTGKAMIEATEEVISPVLERQAIEGGLRVRLGVAVGDIVVTRIGIGTAQEVTAYGKAVNSACKMGTYGSVTVTHEASNYWRGTPNGTVKKFRSGSDWRYDFGGLKMLER